MQGTASTLVWSQQQQRMESDKNNGKVGKLAYQQYVQFLQGIACSSGTYILLNDTPNPKWGFAFKCCNVSYMVQGAVCILFVPLI